MNEFLSIFVNWQFVVLCIGIAAVTFVVRTVIEYAILNNPNMPGNSQSRFWRDLVLVILPIILGMIFAFVSKSFPYPEAIYEPYSKFLFGSSAGLLSPILYRIIKALLWKNVSENAPQIVQQLPVIQNIVEQPSPNDSNSEDNKSSEPKI